MFEETELARNQLPLSPRKRACMNQCRLITARLTGNLEDGNCPCDGPKECVFGLPDPREDKIDWMFDDKRLYYEQVWRGE